MIGKSLKKYNFPKTGTGDQKEKKKKKRIQQRFGRAGLKREKSTPQMTGSPAFCSFQDNIHSLDGGTRGWVIPEDRPLDTDM